jgi:tetratricopeptide (TPR) repeat protein
MQFDGLGATHRAIRTSSAEAQAYFDQGIRLIWAFNHDEATRSFAKAAELDSRCASCFWGVALTVGPNYNLPLLSAERAKIAFQALQLAQNKASHASAVEQALITALGKRYPNDQPLDPQSTIPVLSAYAEAMKTVADRFPQDLDVQTWYAESLMNLHAWKLWQADGTPAMLALPPPNRKLVGLTGGFLFGRAVSLAATGRVDEANVTLADLQKLAASVPSDTLAGQNTVKDVLAIAIPIVQGRIAAAEHRSSEAVSWLREAVAAEDRLAYDEPKDWLFPARHLLGAELLRAGKAPEAERVYREDLRQNPANGWSLYGLSAALKAQGKTAESIRVTRQFADAWKRSDITLAASAFSLQWTRKRSLKGPLLRDSSPVLERLILAEAV